MDIYKQWLSVDPSQRKAHVSKFLSGLYNPDDFSEELENELKQFCKFFCLRIDQKWSKCFRSSEKFEKQNSGWLSSPVNLPRNPNTNIEGIAESSFNIAKGRPQKPFQKCSNKTKKRRVEDLINNNEPEELAFAANISSSSSAKQEKVMTAAQALALYIDLDLSERKYNLLRSTLNEVHANLLPSLYALKKEKEKIIPKQVSASETSAEVDLQDLMNCTSLSIMQQLSVESSRTVKLVCKWGFDGSSGHSTYKQKFSEAESSDESLLVVALVPLKIIDIENNTILWSNPRPCSTSFCRPIKFVFTKEDSHTILNIQTEIEDKIKELHTFTITDNNVQIDVNFEFLLTMIDGKVCNVLSGNKASAKCFICGALPKEMNTSKVEEKVPNKENYKFGVSPLHCWIKSFDCFIHIAYR